jgi:hypothetical protein
MVSGGGRGVARGVGVGYGAPQLQDSPYLAEGEAQFQLDAKGVSDPD